MPHNSMLGNMKRLASLFGLFFCCRALAASDVVCSGDRQLDRMDGYWALSAFTERLAKTRSWSAALTEEISPVASLRISQGVISFSLNWHEGDSGEGNCVRVVDKKLWARSGWDKKWFGPYVRVAVGSKEDEAAYFLGKYFTGCFVSDHREQWCLSPRDITVDGSRLSAKLQMDIADEAPRYGTAFAVSGRSHPFLVFVAQGDGWAIFEDDWTSTEGRIPVNPVKSVPWRKLNNQ